MSAGPKVTIVSPHYDDVPLSLGQSLRDGAMSRCDVTVRIVFGRSNWTNWVHPTSGRARPVTWWRRAEETVASRRFGYRWRAEPLQEALLRWGPDRPQELLDPTSDLSGEPLVGEVGRWLRGVLQPRGGPTPDLVLVPAGLGGHVDHRIVALAAAAELAGRGSELAGRGSELAGSAVPLGFYEDRPYVAYLDEEAIASQLAPLAPDLVPVAVSATVSPATQQRARRCYPSQIDRYFVDAMDRDRAAGAVERVWFPRGAVPTWLA